MQKLLVFLITLFFLAYKMPIHGKQIILADELTRSPLPFASVFDKNNKLIGLTDDKGRLPYLSPDDYPITLKYLGFNDYISTSNNVDSIFLSNITLELPEIVIESKKHSHLHILAYVREYSTLSTLTDTITLFREKMVDFLTPVVERSKIKGWRNPRVLTSKSYYHFTNDTGLDSVSDRCNHHFSWTDWVGVTPSTQIPKKLHNKEFAVDTVFGKYSATELWKKTNDYVFLDVDILADTASRKWVPNLSLFFQKETDFEYFKARYCFSPVLDDIINESNLTGYSFNIESKGRGRGMFMFARHNEPFYVSTYCEVFIIDKEYITSKEATKWEKLKINTDDIAIFVPEEAPQLSKSVIRLIERVNGLNHDNVRLATRPDLSSIGYKPQHVNAGQQILRRLKGLFGIDQAIADRKLKNNYKQFRHNQQESNKKNKNVAY